MFLGVDGMNLELKTSNSLDVFSPDRLAFELPNGEWFRKRLEKVKQGAL